MRITFVVGLADLSGGFRVIATYAQRFKQRGHEVVVVSRPGRKAGLREKLRAVTRGKPQPIDPQRAPTHMEWTGVPHRLLESYRPITARDVPDADIALATWWESAEWVEALPASKGAKVHFIQDYETWGGPETVQRVDATCRLPFPKVTPAKWVKELLETRFGQTDVTLVPNAVDLQKFTALPRGKQPQPTVGFMYTPFLNKGSDVSIKACEIARKRLPNLKIVTFGSVAPTEELPLPADAVFHHKVPDDRLKTIYSACDVWLFGTRKEGFGLPILEAMACRTPVIGTPAGAAPELLNQGGGILVPMEDPQAMADAIIRVLTLSESAWKEMSDNAHATANRYTWEDATDRFEAVLTRVVRDAKTTAPRQALVGAS
jgi:glycosyltransferase involved in cell wall biosynthesis